MGFLSQVLGTKNNFQADSSKLIQPISRYGLGPTQHAVKSGINQQQKFVNELQGQNGIGNQSSVFGQQQSLADQLQQQAMGQGPNPALAQLHQQTGQNAQAQAAMMASQRGAGANVGLLARQAGMQGGALQQQASGQAATLQAQQQLAAQSALQNQQAQMAQLAGTQVGQQAGALQGYNQAAQGNQGQMLGALANQNQNQLAIQGINSGVAEQNAKTNAGLVGGILGSVAPIGGLFKTQSKAHGGEIHGPQSRLAQHLCSGGMYAEGGEAKLSWGGGSEEERKKRAEGAQSGIAKAAADNPVSKAISWLSGKPMEAGGSVPGKAIAKGDSLKNDVVPAMLSPGEVVIPRSVMKSSDPVSGAAEFVKQIMLQKRKKKS